MQLMPETARQLGVGNVFDVRQNIEGGVRHLRNLLDRYSGNLTIWMKSISPSAMGSVQEKIRWKKAALDRIHGQAELLEHGEAQQNGIPGLPKDHPTRNRFTVHSHRSVTDAALYPSSVDENEEDRTEPLDPERAENLSGNHGQSGPGIRQGSDLLGSGAGSGIDYDNADVDLAHTRVCIARRMISGQGYLASGRIRPRTSSLDCSVNTR